MRLDTQLLKGTTPLLVLTVIGDGELYGYEIAQRIRERSGGAFAAVRGFALSGAPSTRGGRCAVRRMAGERPRAASALTEV